MSLMPDTPRYLLIKHQREKALKILQWLRGPHVDPDVECREIEDGLDSQVRSIDLKKEIAVAAHLVFPPCGNICELISNVRNYTKTNEKGSTMYHVSLQYNVILLITCRTNGNIETPVTAQLTHTLLSVPFLPSRPQELLIYLD